MILFRRIELTFSKLIGTLTIGLLMLAGYDIGQHLRGLGVLFSLKSFWWQIVIGCAILSVIALVLVWSGKLEKTAQHLIPFAKKYLHKRNKLLLVLFLVVSLAFSVWVLKYGYIVLNGFRTRLFIFMVISILGMFLLYPYTKEGNWQIALAGAMLLNAAIFKVMMYGFQGISSSPFSLSWSEGSRYYYGSLFFSERIYGVDLPLSPLHPSRYILLAIPFVFQNLPILAHRTWQVILWISLPLLTGFALGKRIKIEDQFLLVIFIAWSFLFINLGPIYYHLLICVILIFFGVNFDKPLKTLIVLLIASIWAGLSRINWIPVPTFLTLTLYFLERPWNQDILRWKYLLKTIPWGFGILTGFIAYFSYIQFSGNQPSKFGSTFTSDLLWNRLFPNPTYSTGILIGALLVTIPLWLVIYIRFHQRAHTIRAVKLLSYLLMILTLFFGGLVVSVKIGGGSNLHNMDAYFTLMLTIKSLVYWGPRQRVMLEGKSIHPERIPSAILAIVILIPVYYILRQGGVVSTPDLVKDQRDLITLQTLVEEIATDGGDILFITERQLQVFSLVPEIKFYPEYEKLILMEMAMAGDQAYLTRFYKDISNKKFDLVITDSVRKDIKDDSEPFSEEHNIWASTVMMPLLGNYESESLGGRTSIYLLTPK